MTQQDAIRKLWRSVFVSIVTITVTSVAAVLITLKVVTEVHGTEIKHNEEAIKELKTQIVPRNEIQNTQGWMTGEINQNRQNCEELRKTVSENYKEVQSELKDIKKILMTE